jgi:hypothetical protein
MVQGNKTGLAGSNTASWKLLAYYKDIGFTLETGGMEPPSE